MIERNTSFEKQCGTKISYARKKEAKSHLLALKRKNKNYRAYLCPHCNKWHVGRDLRVAVAASKAKHNQ